MDSTRRVWTSDGRKNKAGYVVEVEVEVEVDRRK